MYLLYGFQENPSDLYYNGALVDANILQTWAQDKCVPLVREITFENAEVGCY